MKFQKTNNFTPPKKRKKLQVNDKVKVILSNGANIPVGTKATIAKIFHFLGDEMVYLNDHLGCIMAFKVERIK